MAVTVGALVLSTSQPQPVVEFYRRLGVPLVDEDHGDGIRHWACELGDVHFAVFEAEASGGPAPGYHESGSSFAGFVVDSVARTVDELRSAGFSIVQEPTDMPWGRRAVAADPDGRPVEVFERPR